MPNASVACGPCEDLVSPIDQLRIAPIASPNTTEPIASPLSDVPRSVRAPRPGGSQARRLLQRMGVDEDLRRTRPSSSAVWQWRTRSHADWVVCEWNARSDRRRRVLIACVKVNYVLICAEFATNR